MLEGWVEVSMNRWKWEARDCMSVCVWKKIIYTNEAIRDRNGIRKKCQGSKNEGQGKSFQVVFLLFFTGANLGENLIN